MHFFVVPDLIFVVIFSREIGSYQNKVNVWRLKNLDWKYVINTDSKIVECSMMAEVD